MLVCGFGLKSKGVLRSTVVRLWCLSLGRHSCKDATQRNALSIWAQGAILIFVILRGSFFFGCLWPESLPKLPLEYPRQLYQKERTYVQGQMRLRITQASSSKVRSTKFGPAGGLAWFMMSWTLGSLLCLISPWVLTAWAFSNFFKHLPNKISTITNARYRTINFPNNLLWHGHMCVSGKTTFDRVPRCQEHPPQHDSDAPELPRVFL